MNIRATTATVLALAATSSPAATRYDFSYTGLDYDLSWSDTLDGFYPGYAILGHFEGEDTNGDGTFQMAELTEFAYAVASGMPHHGLVHVIGPNFDPWECPGCSLESFEFTPGGTLEFVAHAQGGISFNETVTNTGFLGSWYGDPWTLTMTPETVISVSVVPEPDAKFMFLAGLLGLAYLSKRKAARR